MPEGEPFDAMKIAGNDPSWKQKEGGSMTSPRAEQEGDEGSEESEEEGQ